MSCINIAAGLKLENGVLYAKDDCCNWIMLGSIAGTAAAQSTLPQTFGSLGEIAGGLSAFAAGLPTLPTVPHEIASFNNDWTRKCLKATALKYILQTLLADIRDSAEQIPATGWSQFLNAVSTFLAATPLAKLAIVAQIAKFVTDWGASFLVGEIDAVLADTEKWDDFVCDFADVMTGAETFTGVDISNFYAKAVTYTVLFAEWGLDLIDNLVPTEFQARVNEHISAVTCECSDYLPAGYVPPLGVGSFRWDFAGFGNYPVGSGAPTYIAGVAPPDMNTPVGSGNGLMPKTVYQETQTGGYWNKVHAIYEMSEPVIVSGFQADLVWQSGEPTVDVRMGVMCYRSDTNVWQALIADFSDTPPINQAIIAPGGNIPDVTHLAIYLRARNFTTEGLPKHVTVSNPRIDGNFMGQGFLNLLPGVNFTP